MAKIIDCAGCGRKYIASLATCPNCNHENIPKKQVSIILFIGIALFPILFAWVTLQNGYSTQSKVISFGYLAVSMIVGAILASGSGSY